MWASVVVAPELSSCGFLALGYRINSCGTQASLLCGMWDILGPGIEPVSPELAGRFFTTEPPGKPQNMVCFFFFLRNNIFILKMVFASCLNFIGS